MHRGRRGRIGVLDTLLRFSVKYLVMIFFNPRNPWTDSAEDHRSLRNLFAVQDELAASGELLGAQGLTGSASTVEARGATPFVTDGPFGEAKEQLAGYFLVECADEERAVAIAARISASQSCPVELRPVIEQAAMREAVGLPPAPDPTPPR